MSATPSTTRILRREELLPVLRAALDAGEVRFARQGALAWLAAFPGDLEVTLLQAESILPTGRTNGLIPAVESVLRKDPFYAGAWRLLLRAAQPADPTRALLARSALYGLGDRLADSSAVRAGEPSPTAGLLPWASPLRSALDAFSAGRFVEAGQYIQQAITTDPGLLLPAALHLMIERAIQDAPTTLHLAQIYHTRWPDCLPVSLVLAEANLEAGNEPEAVRLLHLCAAADTSGQVARRLWGEKHPYQALWPADQVIHFDQPIPAGVLAKLGRNNLPQGELRGFGSLLLAAGPIGGAEPAEAPAEPEFADILAPAEPPKSTPEDQTAGGPAGNPQPAGSPQPAGKSETVKAVESEFERLARRLKQPAITRADGRYPVYVIFTSKEGLAAQYGPQTAAMLEIELRRLAGLISHKHGWHSLVYFPDDAACTGRFDLTPVNPRDPWKLKLALADLDAALVKRGERIGALLIVGGDSVVPFHRLPNPTDDADSQVPSDSPYATLDSNYFVPEWPVGRLPGEDGPDAGLLLEQLRQTIRFHGKRSRGGRAFGWDLFGLLRMWFERMMPRRKKPNFGYTAAVWRRSSLAAFRPVGAPHTVLASPPEETGTFDANRITAADLGYYNLHGLVDSPAWYGQRDPMEKDDCPDYPVALTPGDLHRNGRAPHLVFSEACYGGFIFGKNEEDSLALKFLSVGTLGVVASTCISYGSINTPLIAADLLSHAFWQQIKSGRTSGEALMIAKLELVREMNRRQGFLDGEDQKTLISFNLYGDPLASYDSYKPQRKSIVRSKEHLPVAVVADGPEEPAARIPDEALKQVKHIVAEYLPGAGIGEMHFTRQQVAAGSPQPEPRKKNGPVPGGRLVVTVSKQVKTAQHVHKHFMRVTLDEGGKPVKLAISR